MSDQKENVVAMRKKIDAQAEHIRKLEQRIRDLRTLPPASSGVTDMAEELGFTIELRGGVYVLAWHGEGCRPASDEEVALWNTRTLPQPAAVEAVAEVVWPPSEVRHGAFKTTKAYAFGAGTKLYTHPATVPAAVEAVEVVAITNRGVCYWQAPHLLDLLPNGTQLMTVAQHNRIMAATVPAGCKVVQVELLERSATKLHDRGHKEGYELRAILEVKP